MNPSEDIEDELIEEIDVYFCKDLSEELAVFQYPLRSNDRFYGDYGGLTSVTLNKDNMNLKFNYTIDNKLKNFDTQYYTGKNFSQILLGQKIDANTNYCVGLFRNNSLFINPVQNFIQFRNDFSHLEVNDNLNKKIKDKHIPRKESLGSFIDGPKENIWNDLKFYKTDTLQSYQILEKLFFEEESTKLSQLDFLSNKEYQKLFFDNVNREVLLEKLYQKGGERVISYKELIEQPLAVKIEYVLKKINVIPFYLLKRYCLADEVSDKIFLENCLKFANILKNGNLILKSEIRYDPNVKKDLITKRSYVINLLQNSKEGIKRGDIKFLEINEINEILAELSESIEGNLFLKENSCDNKNFIEKFEKFYLSEVNHWDSINIKKHPGVTANVSSSTITKSNLNLISSTSESDIKNHTTQAIANGDNENIPMAIPISMENKLQASTTNPTQETHNKLNIDFVKSSIVQSFSRKDVYLIQELVSNILQNFHIEDNEVNKEIIENIKAICEEMCYSNNRAYFLKELGEGDFNKARKSIIEILLVKKSCKKTEIKSHLEVNSISITDSMLNKLLKLIGVYSMNHWQLKESSF